MITAFIDSLSFDQKGTFLTILKTRRDELAGALVNIGNPHELDLTIKGAIAEVDTLIEAVNETLQEVGLSQKENNYE